MKHFFLFASLIACFFITSCGSTAPEKQSGITPMPDRRDPKDDALKIAVAKLLDAQKAPIQSEYDYVRVDLDGDGRRDGIVLFKIPHTHWCGWDGCGMAVFKANDYDFTFNSLISNVRGPIHVSKTGNRGWRDIIIRISGTRMPDRTIKLTYDGNSYPVSPLLAPTLQQPLSSLETEKFFQ